ncbi:MAG: alpha/beta hydrolase [Sphingomonadales bacterium]|nr:alpha/beta hydrolase [Sphingomonadales bacterium]
MSEAFVRPDTAAFLAFLNSQEGPKMHEIPLADARGMMLAMRHVADAEPTPLAKTEDLVIPGPAGDIKARLYDARPARDPGPVMVFFHGGGFVIGDIDTHEPYCTEAAAQLDMPVISIDYRLAPEHVFPAAPIDCEAAARWVADHIPCTGLILSGDSAGGNLTVVTAMALRDNPASKPVIAQYPIYPAVAADATTWPSYVQFKDGHLLTEESMTWFMDCYAHDTSWQSAPLDYDLAGMPPAVVITAGLDPLRDQGRAYAAKLIQSGVRTTYLERPGTIHGYICLRKGIPSAADDITFGLDALKGLLAELAA